MGINVSLNTRKYGFYPAGGGELMVNIEPCHTLTALHLQTRGETQNAYAQSLICSLPIHIAERELHTVRQ